MRKAKREPDHHRLAHHAAVTSFFVLGIGFALKRFMKTSKDFLQARALAARAWICRSGFHLG